MGFFRGTLPVYSHKRQFLSVKPTMTFCPKSVKPTMTLLNFMLGDFMEEIINYDTQFIDEVTGEVVPIQNGTKIISPDRQKQKQEYALKANQTFTEKNDKYNATQKIRGNFFVSLCQETELFHTEVTEPTLGKLIYLATYIDANNCICHDGNWDKNIRNSIPMSKSDIQQVLQVSRQTFSPFWNECINKELIIENNGAYFLSKKMFRFCNNNNVSTKKTRMIKVFKHAIRYMYENTDERSKKTLIYLYRLIPFINLTHNGLCLNPFETDKDKIEPLSLAEICKLFGIDRRNQIYFLKKLKKLRFIDKQGVECSVIKYSWLYYDKDVYWITINPQFYSGYISEENMVEMVNEFYLSEGVAMNDQGLS